MKLIIGNRLLRFLISGGISFALEIIVFVFVTIFLPIVLSNIISFFTALTINYSLNKVWVFNSNKAIKKQFLSYSVIALANLLISTLIVAGLSHYLHPFIAKLISILFIATTNYFIFRRLF